jgi:hypothetical protein
MGFWDDVKKNNALQKHNRELDNKLMLKKKVELDYLGGFKDIKGKSIKVYQGDSPKTVFINRVEYNVSNIDWQQNHKRSAGKSAVGAIAGTLVAGPIGLIAGAAIGAKRKDASIAVITIIHDNEEHDLYVQCNQIEFKKLIELI